MSKRIKTGLFGGTFAPPHLGHIHAVEAILSQTELDEVIVMPTAVPPHKQKKGDDTPELRLEMCRAAFGDMQSVTVSEYEIMRGGVSYTVNTLEHLTSCEPWRELYLVCGTDMFLTLDKWYRADEIFRLAHILCIPRDETEHTVLEERRREYEERYGAEARILDVCPMDISSTEVRGRIERGEDTTELLPPAVDLIIKREGLYGDTAKNA